MYVKSLTLRGFKSFASKTVLDFNPGIICIVGPNGSGKSNIVDALAWVMGEQGAKNLRGGAMSDVIFAGAGSRTGLGRAEVSLTIDNSAGELPIDYSEVTISRSLLRSGGSEYSINGTPCRLLDIQELLSDTGMGRNMHVIVGQGQLDQVLSADPMQRRALVEEAAGVLKHQRRKDRALRKLTSLEEKLSRLTDLTTEVHRQLGPLARQAKTARKASVLQARQRDAGARLLADDIAQLEEVLKDASRSERALEKQREQLNETVGQLRSEVDRLQSGLAGEGHAARATIHWQELTGLGERLRGLVVQAQERNRGYQQELPRPDGPDLSERKKQLAAWEEQIETAEVEANNTQSEAKRTEESLVEASARVRELSDEYQKLRMRVQQSRDRIERSRLRYEQLAARLETTRNQAVQVRAKLRDANSSYAQLDADFRSYWGELSATTNPEQEGNASQSIDFAALHTAAVEKNRLLRLELESLREQIAQAKSQRAAAQGRAETIAQSLRGQSNQAKMQLLECPQALGTLTKHCKIADDWVPALSAYLGLFGDAVLWDGEATAPTAEFISDSDGIVRWLHAASFSQSLKEAAMAANKSDSYEAVLAPDTPALPSGCKWAAKVVQAHTIIGPVLAQLLSRCVLVDSFVGHDQFLADNPEIVLVNRKGEIRSHYWGQLGSGSGETALTLASQLEAAQKQVYVAEQTLESLEITVAEQQVKVEESERDMHQALEQLRAYDAAQAEQARQRTAQEVTLKNAQNQVERTTAELEQLEKDIAELEIEEAAAKSTWDSAAAEQEAIVDDTLEEKLDEARVLEISIREKLTKAKLTAAAKAETLRQLQARYRGAKQSLERYQLAIAGWEQKRIKRAEQAAKVAHIAAVATDAAELADRALEVATWRRNAAETARLQASEQLLQMRKRLDEAQDRLADVTNQSHRDQVALAEYRVRLAQLEEDSQNRYGMQMEDLVAKYGPHNPVPLIVEVDLASSDSGENVAEVSESEYGPYIRAEQEQILVETTAALNRLGKINPLALAEHEALEKRYHYLMGQLNDLQHSKADLLHLIKEVEKQVDEAFQQAYADISEAFVGVFEKLFPGGKGKLSLTDPDNMLTTGIEIEARPAGKKVKRLSLLSGGERSLAALAFLIAIFTARPSPFYILDEVEAALDDSNLGRMLGLFKQLRQVSQLIIITHQKRTMEIADALYGVSMREGVSTVISQRLNRGEEQ